MIASLVLPVLFPVLFIASGLFAFGCLVLAWATYGGELKAIRRQLAGLDEQRSFAVRLALTETHEFVPAARRSAIRPKAVLRQRSRPALRAAA